MLHSLKAKSFSLEVFSYSFIYVYTKFFSEFFSSCVIKAIHLVVHAFILLAVYRLCMMTNPPPTPVATYKFVLAPPPPPPIYLPQANIKLAAFSSPFSVQSKRLSQILRSGFRNGKSFRGVSVRLNLRRTHNNLGPGIGRIFATFFIVTKRAFLCFEHLSKNQYTNLKKKYRGLSV